MDDKDRLLLANVAYLYYKKGYSQEKIAKSLFLSRSTISRLLQKSLNTGVVDIKINFPFERDKDLESVLQKKYNLKKCYILLTEPNTSFAQVCHYSSEIINDLIHDDMIIGFSSGRTVYNICQNLIGSPKKNLTFTAVKGNAGFDSDYIYDSPETIRLVALKYDAEFNLIYSPLYVFNETVRDYLLNEMIIKGALNIARKTDMIIASVGQIREDELSIYKDYLDYHNMRTIVKNLSVASILGHFLNNDGEYIDPELEKSVIGLTLEEIKNVKNVIVVVSGEEKSISLRSVLKSGIVDTLICDKASTKNLL